MVSIAPVGVASIKVIECCYCRLRLSGRLMRSHFQTPDWDDRKINLPNEVNWYKYIGSYCTHMRSICEQNCGWIRRIVPVISLFLTLLWLPLIQLRLYGYSSFPPLRWKKKLWLPSWFIYCLLHLANDITLQLRLVSLRLFLKRNHKSNGRKKMI